MCNHQTESPQATPPFVPGGGADPSAAPQGPSKLSSILSAFFPNAQSQGPSGGVTNGGQANPSFNPNAAPTSSTDKGGSDAGGTYDPMQDASRATSASAPTTSKFGMLMKVLAPALKGGLIGLAGGKGHPQGGFGAANDFFQQERAHQMRGLMLQRQMQNDQFQNYLRAAQAQHDINMPRFSRVPSPVKAQDAQGNHIMLGLNTDTGKEEPIPGATWEDKETNDPTSYDADRGVVVNRKNNTYTVPVSAGPPDVVNPGPTAPVGPPSGMPTQNANAGAFAPTAPPASMAPDTAAADRAPVTPPKGSGVSPTTATRAGATGGVPLPPKPVKTSTSPVEKLTGDTIDELRAKHPDWSNAQILKEVAVDKSSKQPGDDTVMKPQQERLIRSQALTREESSLRQLQSEQERDLDALNKDEFAAPEDTAKKQADIKTKYDGLRQDLHSRIVGEAASMGVDLDTPMSGGKKGAGGKAPKSAPASTPANTSDRVAVLDPNGNEGTVPRAQLQKALAKGYKQK